MKISLATFIALVSSAHAFAPAFVPRSETVLKMSRPDSSSAIAEAMRLSKEFGPTSVEARLAWEAVEEMDSSDTSVAYSGGEVSKVEYDSKVKALSGLLVDQKENIEKVKSLAAEIKAIKMTTPSSKHSPNSKMMAKVLADAKAIVNEYGADSTQAKLAWETVEEVAASDNSEVQEPGLDEACLVETIEACEAIEEIARVLAKYEESK